MWRDGKVASMYFVSSVEDCYAFVEFNSSLQHRGWHGLMKYSMFLLSYVQLIVKL